MTSTAAESNKVQIKETKALNSARSNSSNKINQNARKYILDLGNGEKIEVFYPNMPAYDNTLDANGDLVKDVYLMVDPNKAKENPTESLCKTLLGIFPDVVFDVETHEFKIIIQGFMPNGPSYKNKNLKLADLILSINDFYVNVDNIESLLSAFRQPKLIKLTVQSPVKYSKFFDTNENLTNQEKYIQAVSRSTDIVQGDRIKETSTNYDIPHSLMIMSLGTEEKSDVNSSQKIDLLYKYPPNNDLFIIIRGMLITLVGTIRDIDNSEAKNCTIRFNNQMMNVSFIIHFNIILALAVPTEALDVYTLRSITNDIKDVIEFSYGGLKKLIHRKNYRKNLDNLFSLLFQRLLLKNDLNNMKSIRYSDDLRLKIFNAIPWFELSNHIKIHIDLKLSAFEAQEFVDADGLYYKNRRLFNIIGCCLFFKSYLIETHLNMNQTMNIFKYCDNRGLLILSSNVIINQFNIWEEVFLKNNLPNHTNFKHYLLIIGYREFIFVTLVEFGSISRKIQDITINIQADPYLVEQAKLVLNDMIDSGILRDVNEWYLKSTLPYITSVDKVFNTQKERNNNLKNRPRSHLANQYIKDLKTNDRIIRNDGLATIKDSRSLIEALNLSRHNLSNFNQFPDPSFYDSVFYYIHSEENSNGIFICPTKYDIDLVYSQFYLELINQFSSSCIKIKKLFDLQQMGFHPHIQQTAMLEQGVLFQLHKVTQRSRSKSQTRSEGKRSSSAEPNETDLQTQMNFWVVGRRETTPHNREFFVCFHDSSSEILQEIAFDIGFARLVY